MVQYCGSPQNPADVVERFLKMPNTRSKQQLESRVNGYMVRAEQLTDYLEKQRLMEETANQETIQQLEEEQTEQPQEDHVEEEQEQDAQDLQDEEPEVVAEEQI